ncbi:MAG: hypothetical protein HY299_11630 [Verrucomicrobia bacterium]|nr:hypothetical protein [Verrucomicrobiota bacterium]
MKPLFPFTLVAALLVGCATPKPPTYQNPSFDTSKVDEITILSVVDARVGKVKQFKWDRAYPKPTAGKLKSKGYKVRLHLDPNLVAGITSESFTNASPEWIRSLGPSDANWIFLWLIRGTSHKVVAVDFSFDMIFWGPKGKAGISAVLFDKQNRNIAWYNEVNTETPAIGGLIGMMLASQVENDAVEAAFHAILSGFPQKAKPK